MKHTPRFLNYIISLSYVTDSYEKQTGSRKSKPLNRWINCYKKQVSICSSKNIITISISIHNIDSLTALLLRYGGIKNPFMLPFLAQKSAVKLLYFWIVDTIEYTHKWIRENEEYEFAEGLMTCTNNFVLGHAVNSVYFLFMK